ncbi:MAG: midcut-by-XrtH protein [Halioglobus sp.]|nr:midcut-by-XrtH protein [Halioglobus sp.]
MYSRPPCTLFVFITTLFCSLAYGQSGSLSYFPTSMMQATPVPTDGNLWLLMLSVAIGGLSYWALRTRETGKILGVILSVSASIALVGGTLYIKNAGALQQAVINLDSSTGGTVDVPEHFQEYLNASGVEIEIQTLTDPCGSGASNMAANACAENRALAQGESCATEYQCPQPEICDGIDNDLDTEIDEGLFPPDLGCPGGETPLCTGAGGWQCPLVCIPDCAGKACGTDGCSGSCGSCGGDSTCAPDGRSCITSVCGDGSCDGLETAGNCPADCPP